jgi:hypothetical protein
MTEQQFEQAMDGYQLDNLYAEFIMENQNVGNGHVLTTLMERGDYYEAFKEKMVTCLIQN